MTTPLSKKEEIEKTAHTDRQQQVVASLAPEEFQQGGQKRRDGYFKNIMSCAITDRHRKDHQKTDQKDRQTAVKRFAAGCLF